MRFLETIRVNMNHISFFFVLIFFNFSYSFSQVFVHSKSLVHLTNGVQVYVDGNFQNANNGQLMVDGNGTNNNAVIYINGDFTNDASAIGNGYIRLTGDWIDNGIYNGGTGTVFLEGAIQVLGGTSPTVFNNLTLDGTNYKIQQIDKAASGILDLKELELKTEIYQFRVLNPSPSAITRIATTPTTGGFVSSLNGGYLHRFTNSSNLYFFPVGSSVGTARYRPVEITPNNAQTDTFKVRLANVDPTIENYNKNSKETSVCSVNDQFYHQILNTSSGNSAKIVVKYISTQDGTWSNLGRWQLSPSALQWNNITSSAIQNNNPFDEATINNWTNFSDRPYALIQVATSPTFSVSSTTGCAPQQITFNSNSPSDFNCVWTFSDGTTLTGCSNVSKTFTLPGCYDVTLTSTSVANNCSASNAQAGYICIEEEPEISFFPTPTQFTSSNETINFTNLSTGATNYIWNFGDGNTAVGATMNHFFTGTTNGYFVTLTGVTDLGCTNSQTIFIEYVDGGGIYIPNTFTPDGDNFNQEFKPIFTINYDRYNFQMEIYNRWGELIFVTKNPDRGWDGSYGTDGRDVQDGTYVYKVIYKNPADDKRTEIVGHVNLIR